MRFNIRAILLSGALLSYTSLAQEFENDTQEFEIDRWHGEVSSLSRSVESSRNYPTTDDFTLVRVEGMAYYRLEDGLTLDDIGEDWTVGRLSENCSAILSAARIAILADHPDFASAVRAAEPATEMRFIDPYDRVLNVDDNAWAPQESMNEYNSWIAVVNNSGSCQNLNYNQRLSLHFFVNFNLGQNPPPSSSSAIDSGAPSQPTRQPALTVRIPYQQVEAPPANVREQFVAIPAPPQPTFPHPCAGKGPGCVVSDSYQVPQSQVQAMAAWQAAVEDVNRRNAAERRRVESVNAERQRNYDAWAAREAQRRREHENPTPN